MNALKKWFSNLSDATKFMLILCILFTMANIALLVLISIKSNETLNTVNSSLFSTDDQTLFSMFNLDDLFNGLKQGFKSIVLLLFNIFGFYISYAIGKFFGFFKSITEMFIDIKVDGWGYLFVLLYNAISLFFDILTLSSFINI